MKRRSEAKLRQLCSVNHKFNYKLNYRLSAGADIDMISMARCDPNFCEMNGLFRVNECEVLRVRVGVWTIRKISRGLDDGIHCGLENRRAIVFKMGFDTESRSRWENQSVNFDLFFNLLKLEIGQYGAGEIMILVGRSK